MDQRDNHADHGLDVGEAMNFLDEVADAVEGISAAYRETHTGENSGVPNGDSEADSESDAGSAYEDEKEAEEGPDRTQKREEAWSAQRERLMKKYLRYFASAPPPPCLPVERPPRYIVD